MKQAHQRRPDRACRPVERQGRGGLTMLNLPQAPTPLAPYGLTAGPLLVVVCVPGIHTNQSWLSALADSESDQVRRSERIARAQGEGAMVCGRACGHAIISPSVCEALVARGFSTNLTHSINSDSIVLIQTSNLHTGSIACRAKCEVMGEIGEKLGGVARRIGRRTTRNGAYCCEELGGMECKISGSDVSVRDWAFDYVFYSAPMT